MILLHGLALLIALIVTPGLLTLCLLRQRTLALVTATTGMLAIVLAFTVALALHITHTPITTLTLTAAHFMIFCLVSAIALLRRPVLRIPLTSDQKHLLLPGIALLLMLIFPYTHFTGIDTYKWQDIATSVRAEAALPWLVHPLSLLGFTPRSYPSAHPILLATIQTMGNLGTDSGFFVISCFTALLGIATAYRFGLTVFSSRKAIAFALCYAMSPVFIRYTHWATGRGLFLALLPAFLTCLLALPRPTAIAGTLGTAILLGLSHKVGLVAVPLFVMLMAIGHTLPQRTHRSATAIAVAIAILIAAACVTPIGLPFPLGHAGGLVRYGITRFAWMMPFAAIGLLAPRYRFASPPWQTISLCLLAAIPLAYERHMYGALLALPWITLLAISGADILAVKWPTNSRMLWRGLAGLTIAATVATVAHRACIATPSPLRRAALFLEQYDPQGPFRIVAPGRARTQVQAYVTGCPRISVNAADNTTIKLSTPPAPRDTLRDTLSAWIAYGRGLFSLSDVKVNWYGKKPSTYTFIIENQGQIPDNGILIYDQEDICIYHEESP